MNNKKDATIPSRIRSRKWNLRGEMYLIEKNSNLGFSAARAVSLGMDSRMCNAADSERA